jgi:transposase
MAGKPVDAALRERILTMRGHGMSVSQIAREVSRAEGTIHTVVLSGRKRGDPRCRIWTQEEISARISSSVCATISVQDAHQIREAALDLRAGGLSEALVAQKLGRKRDWVRAVVRAARKAGDPRAAVRTPDETRSLISNGRSMQTARSRAICTGGGDVPPPGDPRRLLSSYGDHGRSEGAVSSTASCVSPPFDCAPSASAEGAALSVEEKALILSAFRRGATIHSIASHHNRNRNTIKRLLSAHGLLDYIEPVDAKPRQVEQPRERRCLGGCGRMFRSTWIGHRICERCRSSEGAGAWA